MQDSCVTFDNFVSQVSLPLSLPIPKRRELEVQSQPTENLQMDVSLLAQGSTSTHSISPPWESFRANFKAYTCLKKQQGEPLMQCSSGQPGTASAPLCCRTLGSLPSLTPLCRLSQSEAGTVLTQYCSQTPAKLSNPSCHSAHLLLPQIPWSFGINVAVPLLCPIFRGETVTLLLLRMNVYSTIYAYTWQNL